MFNLFDSNFEIIIQFKNALIGDYLYNHHQNGRHRLTK